MLPGFWYSMAASPGITVGRRADVGLCTDSVLAPTLTSCVTLCESCHFHEPQFPYLQNRRGGGEREEKVLGLL